MDAAEILLIEDNPHDTLLVIKAIGDNPAYRLRAVDDGEQAMAYLRQQEPFTDVIPPMRRDGRFPQRLPRRHVKPRPKPRADCSH